MCARGRRDRTGGPNLVKSPVGNYVRERWTGQDVVINLPALAIGWRAVPLLRPGVRR